jgi:hypothetical protein
MFADGLPSIKCAGQFTKLSVTVKLQIVRPYPVPDSEEADIARIGVSFNYYEISMMQLHRVEESVFGCNFAALSRKTTSPPSASTLIQRANRQHLRLRG